MNYVVDKKKVFVLETIEEVEMVNHVRMEVIETYRSLPMEATVDEVEAALNKKFEELFMDAS